MAEPKDAALQEAFEINAENAEKQEEKEAEDVNDQEKGDEQPEAEEDQKVPTKPAASGTPKKKAKGSKPAKR